MFGKDKSVRPYRPPISPTPRLEAASQRPKTLARPLNQAAYPMKTHNPRRSIQTARMSVKMSIQAFVADWSHLLLKYNRAKDGTRLESLAIPSPRAAPASCLPGRSGRPAR